MPLMLTSWGTTVSCHNTPRWLRVSGGGAKPGTGGPSLSQIIMVRLQRVTFLALHNYLGLTTELFNPVSAASAS